MEVGPNLNEDAMMTSPKRSSEIKIESYKASVASVSEEDLELLFTESNIQDITTIDPRNDDGQVSAQILNSD